MVNCVYYFGYGALQNPSIIREIVGRTPKGGYGAILEQFDFGYQSLDQIPEPPKDILNKIYGPNFKAYTIRKGNGYVGGVVWELNQQEFNLIKKWEFVGVWREIILIPIRLFNGHLTTSFTTKIYDNQAIKNYVDSLNYDDNLNPQGKMVEQEDKLTKNSVKKMREIIASLKEYKNI